MPNVALSWQQAAGVGVVLAGIAVLLRRTGRRRSAPFVREVATISALYAMWQFAGAFSLHDTGGAFRRAEGIERFETDWWLPSEARVQALALPHPALVQAANLYYATVHFAALFVFLLWLFVRHRDRYPQVRTTLIGLTATCLLIQLVPVAPPRLLPGFVDTASQYGQSVYAGGLGTDQLSAMPSVHVGWALLIACGVVWAGTSPWRWLVLAHPVLTVLVVVATANHFWLDGIVAAVLLVLVVAAQAAAHRVRGAVVAAQPAVVTASK